MTINDLVNGIVIASAAWGAISLIGTLLGSYDEWSYAREQRRKR